MKNSAYEDYFKEKISMKRIATLLVLFSLLAVSTVTEKAGAESTQKTGPAVNAEQQAQTAAGEGSAKAPGEEGQKNAAAKVNGVVITNDSVIKVMKTMLEQKERKERPEELREKALDSLILQELAWQKAKATGLTVEQKTIDEAMEKIKSSYGGESGFSSFLQGESMTEEGLREVIVKSFTLKLLFAREVSEKATVTEDELKQEYEKDKEKHLKPEKVSVIDVIFFLKMDDAESLKKAEGVLKKINEDEEKNPLKLVPDGTFLVREIELNKEAEPELYEAAKKLKEDELSGVIRTSDSFHVLKLKAYQPEKQLTFDEARYSIEARLRMAAQKKRMQEFIAELKKGAKIEIIETKVVE
jgi:hypothetical protein